MQGIQKYVDSSVLSMPTNDQVQVVDYDINQMFLSINQSKDYMKNLGRNKRMQSNTVLFQNSKNLRFKKESSNRDSSYDYQTHQPQAKLATIFDKRG